ncbi:MAG TPA: D-alanyl-D-alanine carboxypeptidase [Firmicutes bacterium]|jgi:serine-type D-Ala-D-Ala carboxypeptidase (penicillin-binding protein 5/6)|nr:D-alanyl-D-alanine carboxypeptidase [Bacillota bacterium]
MKIFSKWCLILCVITISGIALADDLPNVHASAAVLINADNGELLFAKNPHAIMAPASTTKIMTAILAIEKGNLDKKITISRSAAATPGSSMYLHRGEVQTMRNLLYGLMLASGNDSATAIAESIAGSQAGFARMMTEKAHQLGMKDTQYKNASGLPAKGHYTTAYDMALLARYSLKNPTFAEIVQTKVTSVPSSRSRGRQTLTNHNKLLWQYPYTTGIKTGYTRRAGKCLVASADQNGQSLITIVLKSNSMYNDSIQLFNFGFQKITPIPNSGNNSSNYHDTIDSESAGKGPVDTDTSKASIN